MSNGNQKQPTSNEKPAMNAVPTAVVVEEKPNALVRGFRKIRSTPPKTAIAIVGGVALVTAGAVLGRKTAPYHVAVIEDEFVPEPLFEVPPADESNDTVA